VSDTYVGIKLALTEQFGYFPQVAIIPQMTIATEAHSEVDGRVLPGLNVDCKLGGHQEPFQPRAAHRDQPCPRRH